MILAQLRTEVVRSAVRVLDCMFDFIGRKLHATDNIKECPRFFHLM